MSELDPRDAELVEIAASVIGRLVVAHRRGDVAEVAAELGRLLKAVAAYSNTLAERPSDAALVRAIALAGR
jgi:hypothetical protein